MASLDESFAFAGQLTQTSQQGIKLARHTIFNTACVEDSEAEK